MKEFCSVEVFGYKFTVPCNFEEILSANYGNKTEWSLPKKSDYFKNIDWRNGVERSELEIPYSIRFFHKNGSIDVATTLKSINIYFAKINKTLLTLPNDDE